jgi:hypothetical protein
VRTQGEHGPEENIRLHYILPFDWYAATDAQSSTLGITLTDVAKAAVDAHIYKVMQFYEALKEAKAHGTQAQPEA